MSELAIEVSSGRIRAIPVQNLATAQTILAGPGELMGWSFRESGAEVGLDGSGNVTTPVTGQAIASIPSVPPGQYLVNWAVALIANATASEADNFELTNGATNVMASVNPGAIGFYPQDQAEISVPVSQTVAVKCIANGALNAVYAAQLTLVPAIAGQAILELRDGNSPLAEVTAGTAGSLSQWYGPEGIRFYNQITANPVLGLMVGAVYARFGRAHGWT